MNIKGKPLERLRGLFNYYFCFAGFFHSVTNRILKSANKNRYSAIIKYLLKQDYIPFESKNLKEITAFVDASLYAIAAIVDGHTVSMPSSAPILL